MVVRRAGGGDGKLVLNFDPSQVASEDLRGVAQNITVLCQGLQTFLPA